MFTVKGFFLVESPNRKNAIDIINQYVSNEQIYVECDGEESEIYVNNEKQLSVKELADDCHYHYNPEVPDLIKSGKLHDVHFTADFVYVEPVDLNAPDLPFIKMVCS